MLNAGLQRDQSGINIVTDSRRSRLAQCRGGGDFAACQQLGRASGLPCLGNLRSCILRRDGLVRESVNAAFMAGRVIMQLAVCAGNCWVKLASSWAEHLQSGRG
jgi:hypothetical protein